MRRIKVVLTIAVVTLMMGVAVSAMAQSDDVTPLQFGNTGSNQPAQDFEQYAP